ncbi:uncharacterized protein FMAN_12327 [Fusarium mangiferae]|uniref:Uncharacterized protein n=1 Tax=Fusarium mangiferae TaxID=192010 RepID=A0A1L7TSS6_FUSMA|nr:uncharacterized protein FMAN_12327 [Fusarium mangiferae]CVK98311.1 uncharacterized protein FMAN_12327 [Fusarium mangiferae]
MTNLWKDLEIWTTRFKVTLRSLTQPSTATHHSWLSRCSSWSAHQTSINPNDPIPMLSCIGSAPSSPHALKEAIRGGIRLPPELLEINAALRRERAHDIDLEKSRRHRSRRQTEDPIAYEQRVTADKKSWSLKNPDKVL